MDFRDYKQGALGLVGLAVMIVVINQFGSQDQKTKDPIISVKNLLEVPVDNTPVCVAKNPDTAPPVYASAPDPNGIAVRQVFDRLVEFDRRSGMIVPGLATRWEISDDRLVYTFHLRKHVNFHTVPGYTPTRAFNVNDVLFSFSRYIVEDNPYYDPNSIGFKDYHTVDMPGVIDSVTRRDPHIVEIALSVPYPKFLANLTMDFAAIQSKEYAEAMDKAGTRDKFTSMPVGTGAFSVAQNQNGKVLYAANPTYWGNFLAKETPELKRQLAPQEIIGTD